MSASKTVLAETLLRNVRRGIVALWSQERREREAFSCTCASFGSVNDALAMSFDKPNPMVKIRNVGSQCVALCAGAI